MWFFVFIKFLFLCSFPPLQTTKGRKIVSGCVLWMWRRFWFGEFRARSALLQQRKVGGNNTQMSVSERRWWEWRWWRRCVNCRQQLTNLIELLNRADHCHFDCCLLDQRRKKRLIQMSKLQNPTYTAKHQVVGRCRRKMKKKKSRKHASCH